VSRAHRQGEVVSVEHDESGTLLRARVPESLANELRAADVA
jgi:GTP-binding protein HflX